MKFFINQSTFSFDNGNDITKHLIIYIRKNNCSVKFILYFNMIPQRTLM